MRLTCPQLVVANEKKNVTLALISNGLLGQFILSIAYVAE